MPSHLDIFMLSKNQSIMKMFVQEIDDFYSNKVYYQDTDSLYILIGHYEKLREVSYVGKLLGQEKMIKEMVVFFMDNL